MEESLPIFINPNWGASIDSVASTLLISPFFAPSDQLESTNGSVASTLPSTAIADDILAIFIAPAWYSDPPMFAIAFPPAPAIAPAQGQLFPLGV